MDFTGKNVYLSGPMSGIEDWNAPAFRAARDAAYSMGARCVYDPTDIIGAYGTHEEYMRADLHALTRAADPFDALVMLDGWERSAGATAEVAVARACGIETVNASELSHEM